MIIKAEALNCIEQKNPRGGNGSIFQYPYLEQAEIFSKLTGFNLMTLPPGASIGYHQHIQSEELYYILEGTPTVCDNGVESVVSKGTVIWTCNVGFHGMENKTDTDVKFLAFVINID